MSTDNVVKCILADADGKEAVLLGLDEVVNSFGKPVDHKKVTELITLVGQGLNTLGSQFNAVITTLDILVVNAERTVSHRPINWIVLPRLTIEQSYDLFHEQLTEPTCPKYLRWLIVACGGHGRSLDLLHVFYKDHKHLPMKFAEYLQALADDLRRYNTFSLPAPLLLVALRNQELDLKSRLEGYADSQTVQECITLIES